MISILSARFVAAHLSRRPLPARRRRTRRERTGRAGAWFASTCARTACAWLASLAFVSATAAAAGAQEAGAAPQAAAPAGETGGGEAAGALTGLDVATRMDNAQRADTEHSVMTMTLQNARGQQRVRTIEGWSHEKSEDEEQRFARFLEPADVKDTTLLTYDYDERDDDIWLYLPALKKVKRILSSNKTDYFMGSDFTYWDMENTDLINWDYTLVRQEDLDGTKTHVVEAKPKNEKEIEESGYDRVVFWVAEQDWLPRRVEYTDTKGRLAKRLTSSDVRPADNDTRPRARKLLMENFLTKHQTTLAMSKVELDVPVDDDLFSERNMRP